MFDYDSIVKKVPDAFKKGVELGDVCFYSSSTALHDDATVEFEVRLCPSLDQKQPASRVGDAVSRKEHDPFMPPYVPGLYVDSLLELDENYVVLLNKYCVVEQHFLLVTKDFKSQTSPLSPSDLVASYHILAAAQRLSKPFFMFYNCGPLAGSSQKHKHMQFLPLQDAAGSPIEKLAKRQNIEKPGAPFQIATLPYAHSVIRLSPHDQTRSSEDLADILTQAFVDLLDLTIQDLLKRADGQVGPPAYNVLMTLDHIHMIPRRQEEYILSSGDTLAVNALGFAGMLMVKSEEQKAELLNEGPMTILKSVGLLLDDEKAINPDVE